MVGWLVGRACEISGLLAATWLINSTLYLGYHIRVFSPRKFGLIFERGRLEGSGRGLVLREIRHRILVGNFERGNIYRSVYIV